MLSTTKRRGNYERLAKKSESDYKNNPKAYKRKLKWLALLGYGYLFFILLLCMGLITVMVYLSINSSWFWVLLIKKKLIIVQFIIMYTIFKVVTVKIPLPEGYRLTKKQAPGLFWQLLLLKEKLKTVKIHEVVITPAFNAAIQQTPRLWVFGWHKNSLILGAELLMALSQQQVIAIIAHEMGHFSGGHSKFNGWIYRVRMSWIHLVTTMGNLSGIVTWVFGMFFNWYAPYFNAYSFALARANEYEVDRIAAQLTSPQECASALTKVFVISDLISQNYWKQLEQKAYQTEQVEERSLSQLWTLMKQWQFDPAKVEQSINETMKVKTSYVDTHPALSDRLLRLKVSPEFDYLAEKTVAKFREGVDGWKDINGQLNASEPINLPVND